MKAFKNLVIFLLVALLTVGITACSGKTAETDNAPDESVEQETSEAVPEEVTLELWHVWAAESESNRAPFLKVLDDFQAEYPNIKLQIDETEAQTYLTKIRTAAAADELPDVFYYQAGGLLKNFVDAGKVLPLDEYLTDGTMDRIIPGTLTNMTFDEKVYGLPYTLACAVFFVNAEMFEQYDVKIPVTYDELIDAVVAFRNEGITPMTVGAKDLWPTTQYFDLLAVRTAGYDACMAALTGQGSFEDPGIVEAARKLQELVDLGAFNEGALGLTRDEAEVPFYEGKIPMYVSGNWTCANIQNSSVKDKVVAMKFPAVVDGKGSINDFTGGAAEGFYVSSATEYVNESVAAVKYITENHSREAFLAGAGMPTWKFEFDESQIDPLILQVVENTKDAETFTLWWNTLLESDASETYHSELSSLFAGLITPEQFGSNMQQVNE